jgi:hypothetical protein
MLQRLLAASVRALACCYQLRAVAIRYIVYWNSLRSDRIESAHTGGDLSHLFSSHLISSHLILTNLI